jgi:hypothetical protein
MFSKLVEKKLSISGTSFFKGLVVSLLSVFAAHFAVAIYYFDSVTRIKFGTVYLLDVFFFEFEKNIPSFFSAFLLVIAALLLKKVYVIYKSEEKKGAGYWRFLSNIFYFLALDEWVSLHENLNFLGSNFLHAPSWLIFYLPAILILGLVMIKFLKLLPTKVMLLFILSGFVYVSGAAFFEMVSSWSATFVFNDINYQLILFLEDGLEMLGVMLFIKTLIDYLKDVTGNNALILPARGLTILTCVALIEATLTFMVN